MAASCLASMNSLPRSSSQRSASTPLPQRNQMLRLIGSAVLLSLSTAQAAYAADTVPQSTTHADPISLRPLSGERLSAWLLRQPRSDNAYLPGLSWRVPAEMPTQAAMKSVLRSHLIGSEWTFRADSGARERLSEWIDTLPVTGRVPVDIPDARWLEAHPAQDPVLAADHRVIVPARPASITVVTSQGHICVVTHKPGHTARAYVDACQTAAALPNGDWVWLAQPDGRLRNYGIGSWNSQTQEEPAPGAWLWAPAIGSGWSDEFSQSLIAFLATQGPAGVQVAEARAPSTHQYLAAAPAGLPTRLRDPVLTGNDWGGIGLLQTPSARMAPAGELSIGFSRAYPYSRLNVTMQPLDWLELSYRYTSISGVRYGPQSLSGDQSYKDKGVDLKVRLLKETASLPELAIGARDMVGTGLFSGEYVVANKRTGNFDWSLGLGWGSLGSRGSLGNPFGVISDRFNTRGNATNPGGGQFGLNSFFRGPTSLFGGVQMQTAWDPLVLKLEYDGSDYKFNNQFAITPPKSPFNFGAVYRVSPSMDLTFGVQRGKVATLSVAFHAPLARLATPKTNDPVLPRFVPERPITANWSTTAEDLKAHTGWRVAAINKQGAVLRVEFENAEAVYWRDMVERATAILHRDAPADVNEFHFVYQNRGAVLASHVVNRDRWVKPQARPLPPSEVTSQRDASARFLTSDSRGEKPMDEPIGTYQGTPAETPAINSISVLRSQPTASHFSGDFGFALKQSLGGPDGFILYQASLEGRSEWHLTKSTWLSGALNLRLFDNYDKFKYTADSQLPRVRTYVREYLTTSRVTMPNLQLTHVSQLSSNQYISLYGGYLESMYAGAGGEWLYRPFAGPLALGVDVNAVRQRDFDQMFGLRDYRALTGHVTAYIETGWNDVLAKVSVGQYLAKDKGVTLDLSRRFSNGVVFGAYATKTNVSAAQFGEGSFDKGIYFSIPLSAMFTRSTPDVSVFTWAPLTRDGGAKLNRAYPLYELTKVRDARALTIEPPAGP